MCNLYSNTMPVDAMRHIFNVAADRSEIGNAEPLSAIFPKTVAPIVGVDGDGQRWLRRAQWGFVLPQVSKRTGKPIQPKAVNNARDDKLRSSPFWSQSFAARRCLIPATSYCEAKGLRPATYVWFGLTGDQDRPPFAFAGIWRLFKVFSDSEPQREIMTSSMVTTSPNALTRDAHPDRMPMILHPADYDTWLNGSAAQAFDLIKPFPADQMVVHQSGEGLKSDAVWR